MPFGSMMNSFAIANQGKGISAEEWCKVAEVLYLKAKELVEKENPPVTEFPDLPFTEIEL